MIGKNCKYSYYAHESPKEIYTINLDWRQILELFQSRQINSITGFLKGIIIRTCDSIVWPRYYSCEYSLEMIKNLFGFNYGITDILNTHIGRNCKTAEEAQIWFMAKVLGQHG